MPVPQTRSAVRLPRTVLLPALLLALVGGLVALLVTLLPTGSAPRADAPAQGSPTTNGVLRDLLLDAGAGSGSAVF